MTLAYLLPSNRPEKLKTQIIALQNGLMRSGDTVEISNAPGMTNAMRLAFANVKADIVRNCADDDDYCLPGSTKAIEIMEADPTIGVMVTGGVKSNRKPVCVPIGAHYGASLNTVAQYGACGSGLFMRSEAVRKHGLLDYDGRLIDNFIVLKAIASGLRVVFCRLDTYRHHMSLAGMTDREYAEFQREKKALRSAFGIWGVPRRSHEAPPRWDGALA